MFNLLSYEGKSNQKSLIFHLTISLQSHWQSSRKEQQMMLRMRRERNPHTLEGTVNWCKCYGNQYGGSSKCKRMAYCHTTLGHTSKKCKSIYKRDSCILMFIAALLTFAKLWSQLKLPTTNMWIRKIWYILIP
jgi:hypothetical protein